MIEFCPRAGCARGIALLVLLISPWWVQGTSIDDPDSFSATIEIQDFGIYTLLNTREREFEAESTAGYASVISTRHLRETTEIPLREGVVFGFNFAITDAAVEGEWIPVTIRVHHPSTVNYLGQQSTGFDKSVAARLKPDGRYHNGAFYIFSEPNELVPGQWVISVTYRGTVSVSRRFTVR